jgi:ABC-type nitrate/sulfonate/bicarbonate transport system permease component
LRHPLVIKSINAVDPSYLDVAKTKGATQWQLVKDVLVPVAMPNIWDHLRGVYGVGWGWIILAEVVNGQEGIGYLMSISEKRGHTESIFAIIIVIVLVATISDKVWKTIGKYLFPYRRAV